MNTKRIVFGIAMILIGGFQLYNAATVPESTTNVAFVEEGSRIMFLVMAFGFFGAAYYFGFRQQKTQIKTV